MRFQVGLHRSDFEHGFAHGAEAADALEAAEEFAEHAWNEHDMWECPEGFEVFVKPVDQDDIEVFKIDIEFEPSFRATSK